LIIQLHLARMFIYLMSKLLNMTKYDKLEIEFNALTPVGEIQWMLSHKDEIKVYLDSDITYMKFKNELKEPPTILTIYNYFGDTDGVFQLLTCLGIDAEII